MMRLIQALVFLPLSWYVGYVRQHAYGLSTETAAAWLSDWAKALAISALGFIDGSVVAIAIPAMRSNLGASLVEAQWISNAYALTLSALILAGGAAGDKFGLRSTLIVGIALFIGGSMVCAVLGDYEGVPNSEQLAAIQDVTWVER